MYGHISCYYFGKNIRDLQIRKLNSCPDLSLHNIICFQTPLYLVFHCRRSQFRPPRCSLAVTYSVVDTPRCRNLPGDLFSSELDVDSFITGVVVEQ